jgi:hypothetical protein
MLAANVRVKSKTNILYSTGNKNKKNRSILDFAGIFKNEDFIDVERLTKERKSFLLGRAF